MDERGLIALAIHKRLQKGHALFRGVHLAPFPRGLLLLFLVFPSPFWTLSTPADLFTSKRWFPPYWFPCTSTRRRCPSFEFTSFHVPLRFVVPDSTIPRGRLLFSPGARSRRRCLKRPPCPLFFLAAEPAYKIVQSLFVPHQFS